MTRADALIEAQRHFGGDAYVVEMHREGRDWSSGQFCIFQDIPGMPFAPKMLGCGPSWDAAFEDAHERKLDEHERLRAERVAQVEVK